MPLKSFYIVFRLMVFFGIFLMGSTSMKGQFFNKEIKAKILVEKNSEFYTFIATAENVTPSNYNLSYDYMIFTQDENGDTEKANRVERFYSKANQKEILTNLTVNFNLEGKTILVLIIYDVDGKPIGRDRIVLEEGGKSDIPITPEEELFTNAGDQARPQDGFVLQGFVLEKTITKAGRDFYRYFYSEFYNRQIITTKNILIKEVPGRGRNTRISVTVDDQLVWRFFAQPRKEFLKSMASTSLNRVLGQLQRLEQQNEQFTRY